MALIAHDPMAQVVVPQGTPEWVRERIGHLTASDMGKALAFSKQKGKEHQELKERIDLKFKILAEREIDAAIDNYVTPYMEWGLQWEGESQEKYAELSGATLAPGGFVKHRSIPFFGASPDRFVDHDGLLETKCPQTTTHLRWLLNGVVPEEHKPQMLAQLACTGRRWVDFCSYDPRMKNEKRRIFVRRFEPTRQEIEFIEEAARKFLDEVEMMFDIRSLGLASVQAA